MHHYHQDKWQKYIDNELEQWEVQLLEEHLYQCDECMNVYLSLLEGANPLEEIEPSLDFTSKVFEELNLELPSTTKNEPYDRKVLFKYYVVAASITMVLMYGGIFDLFLTEVPRATSEMISSSKRVEEIVPAGWSQRMLDSTFEKLELRSLKQGSDVDEN
ncbi:anti-sigma factor [Alkaliphilus transvaalensis]|uniref:hypothetical protein n=1 Tax=Alkaliphilus transvaalensis TaxID=114628 RepID=UPI00047CC5B5|nr:hypothetical protein [Alkaliphilus transvaalensis]